MLEMELIISFKFGGDDFGRNVVITQTPSVSVTTTNSVSIDTKQKALDQQFSANRALDDLNSLIGQLTASVNLGAVVVDRIIGLLATSRASSSQCNDIILELSNNQVRAQTDIDTLTFQVEQTKRRLADFTPALNSLINRRDDLVKSRDSIERSKSPKANLLGTLQRKFVSCNN